MALNAGEAGEGTRCSVGGAQAASITMGTSTHKVKKNCHVTCCPTPGHAPEGL